MLVLLDQVVTAEHVDGARGALQRQVEARRRQELPLHRRDAEQGHVLDDRRQHGQRGLHAIGDAVGESVQQQLVVVVGERPGRLGHRGRFEEGAIDVRIVSRWSSLRSGLRDHGRGHLAVDDGGGRPGGRGRSDYRDHEQKRKLSFHARSQLQPAVPTRELKAVAMSAGRSGGEQLRTSMSKRHTDRGASGHSEATARGTFARGSIFHDEGRRRPRTNRALDRFILERGTLDVLRGLLVGRLRFRTFLGLGRR